MTDRDARGRFTKGNGAANGNKGGPGRPKKKREERYLEITLNAVSFADWERIVKKARDQALRGNAQARKFLADYLIGPPTQKVEGDLNITGALDVTDDRFRQALDHIHSGRDGSPGGSD